MTICFHNYRADEGQNQKPEKKTQIPDEHRQINYKTAYKTGSWLAASAHFPN